MSNKQTTNGNAGKPNDLTPAQVNENLYQSMIRGDVEPIDRDKAFDMLMGAPETDTEDLSGGDYFKFDDYKKGDKFVFIVHGLTKWNDKQGKEVKAVKIEDKDGKRYVCAAAILYNACEKLTQLPCFVRVTYEGMSKTDKGKMYDMKVEAFKSAPTAPRKGENGEDLPF
jgi:hypothetical protein